MIINLMFMDKMIKICIVFVCILGVIGCSKKKEQSLRVLQNIKQSNNEGAVPNEVVNFLEDIANREGFGDKPSIKESWMISQLEAWRSINTAKVRIPIKDYIEITKISSEKFSEDFVEQKMFIDGQVDSYILMSSYKNSYSPQEFEFASENVKRLYPNDYKLQVGIIYKWLNFIKLFNESKFNFENMSDEELLKVMFESDKNNPDAALINLRNNIDSKKKLNSFIPTRGIEKQVEEMKIELRREFPNNFSKQYFELRKYDLHLRNNVSENKDIDNQREKEDIEKKKMDEIAKENKIQKLAKESLMKAKTLFRDSVFTTRGELEKTYMASLVKYNGKVVILCPKEFLSTSGGSVKFSNSRGTIVCSRMAISKDFPVLMMFPDSEPKDFNPIEIISKDESLELFDRKLFMIMPHGAGIDTTYVSVFSEDEKFLNLSYGTAPSFERSSSIKAMDRNANRILVSVTEKESPAAESVIIDSVTEKLVSLAVRRYSAGVVTWTGRTGSMLGHEGGAIPDFNNFVRQFDSTRKASKPFSTINFVRMTALTEWENFDPKKLEDQKTALRKLEDSNNDFLQFFKENRYGYAVKSFRLGRIAERHKKPLTSDRMERRTYEARYRDYIMDILTEMRLNLPSNANNFYSIYKEAMEFQIELRKSMCKYLSESLKSGDIIGIIHADLKTRYQNPNNPKVTPMGGDIGGGLQ